MDYWTKFGADLKNDPKKAAQQERLAKQATRAQAREERGETPAWGLFEPTSR